MIAYRIEDKDGAGPYASPDYRDDVGHDEYHVQKEGQWHNRGASAYSRHCDKEPDVWLACPNNDDGIRDDFVSGVHVCAFPSLSHLAQWFPCPTGRAAMEKEGYRVVVYDITDPDARRGSLQVTFKAGLAHKLQELQFRELKL